MQHDLYDHTETFTKLTSKFEDDARPPVASVPYIIMLFCTLLTCCMLLAVFNPSQGVCVDDGELGEGPAVFPVPVLLAAPEEEGCFLFLLFWWQKQIVC